MSALDAKLLVFYVVVLLFWGIVTNSLIRVETTDEYFEPILIEFATRLEEVELNYQHKYHNKKTP